MRQFLISSDSYFGKYAGLFSPPLLCLSVTQTDAQLWRWEEVVGTQTTASGPFGELRTLHTHTHYFPFVFTETNKQKNHMNLLLNILPEMYYCQVAAVGQSTNYTDKSALQLQLAAVNQNKQPVKLNKHVVGKWNLKGGLIMNHKTMVIV